MARSFISSLTQLDTGRPPDLQSYEIHREMSIATNPSVSLGRLIRLARVVWVILARMYLGVFIAALPAVSQERT